MPFMSLSWSTSSGAWPLQPVLVLVLRATAMRPVRVGPLGRECSSPGPSDCTHVSQVCTAFMRIHARILSCRSKGLRGPEPEPLPLVPLVPLGEGL